MTLQHANRVRRTGGKHVVRELQAAEAREDFSGGLTEDHIRQRAHEIYLDRNGVPGNAIVDWLRAEIELCARK